MCWVYKASPCLSVTNTAPGSKLQTQQSYVSVKGDARQDAITRPEDRKCVREARACVWFIHSRNPSDSSDIVFSVIHVLFLPVFIRAGRHHQFFDRM